MNDACNLPCSILTDYASCTEIAIAVVTKRSVVTPTALNVSNDSQKWRGLFGGPFVIKTFAAHLSAIDGCVHVPGLHDSDTPTSNAVGALGLAAASVSALYWACKAFLIAHRWSGLWN